MNGGLKHETIASGGEPGIIIKIAQGLALRFSMSRACSKPERMPNEEPQGESRKSGLVDEEKPTSRRRRVGGFSLIELLMVVSIIAILMSILLPALAQAKDTAKAITCANNLRQMYQGVSLYASDWDGYFPPSYSSGGGFWVYQLNSYLSAQAYGSPGFSASKVTKAAKCPSAPVMYWAFAYISVYDTARACFYLGSAGRGYRNPIPASRILTPSALVFMADAQRRVDTDLYPYDAIMAIGTTGNVAEQHARGANWLFFDGHAGKYKCAEIQNADHDWRSAPMP